jgi:cell division septum initiation protein DivIVA
MEPNTPQDAQRIVAAYLKIVATHAADEVYPCSIGDLPESKEIVRAAFRTCVTALVSGDQLTSELRDYLEIAYVSLADYVDEECLALLREYGQAGEELVADRRLAREKMGTEAWQRLSQQSRLAGQLARTISEEAERLRDEFRSWQPRVTVRS